MSEMVDKVAKAVHAHMLAKNGKRAVGKWDEIPDDHDFFREYARAAIEAMMTPTDGMENAAWDAHEAYEKSTEGFWDGPKSIYQAMITAALEE